MAQGAQRGERGARVLDLVRAGQGGQRQVEKPGFILEDQPPAFFPDMPVLAMGEERRAQPAARASITSSARRPAGRRRRARRA
jgi:hypothetical protein